MSEKSQNYREGTWASDGCAHRSRKKSAHYVNDQTRLRTFTWALDATLKLVLGEVVDPEAHRRIESLSQKRGGEALEESGNALGLYDLFREGQWRGFDLLDLHANLQEVERMRCGGAGHCCAWTTKRGDPSERDRRETRQWSDVTYLLFLLGQSYDTPVARLRLSSPCFSNTAKRERSAREGRSHSLNQR